MDWKYIIALVVVALLAGAYLGRQTAPSSPILDDLSEKVDSLEKVAQRSQHVADSLVLISEKSEEKHLPDTVYTEIIRKHNEKIVDLINADLDHHLRFFSKWTSQADSLRRRYTDSD